MRINVATLPPEGLEVKEKLSLELLNARMDEGRGNDIRFNKPPITLLQVSHQAGGVAVNGEIVATYDHPCPRCIEPIPREIKQTIALFFKKQSDNPVEENDDIGICYFDGLHIELEEYLQEELILAINPFEYLPSFCEGRNCEQQQSESKTDSKPVFSLQDKLKDAGIK